MRKSTSIAVVSVLFVCLGTSSAWAQGATPEQTPAAAVQVQASDTSAPKLEIVPDEWNFGVKWYGEDATAEVAIRNAGGSPLTIKNVRSSCGCTVAKPANGTWVNRVLQPGETETMSLSYNTRRQSRTVSQTITIESDDPETPRFAFRVSGEVKQAFDVLPQDRIVFAGLERETAATETVELINNMDEPIQLRLKETAGAPFDLKLDEVESGRKYKLSVTTKPPLSIGANSLTVELETGLEKNPMITIPVNAYIPPRVSVSPPRLFVSPAVRQPFHRVIRVTHRPDNPIEIREIKSSHESITAEIMPPNPGANPSRAMQFIEVRVNLPAGDEFPAEGARLDIYTTDVDPEYQKLSVDIVIRDLSAGRAAHQHGQGATTATQKPQEGGETKTDKP